MHIAGLRIAFKRIIHGRHHSGSPGVPAAGHPPAGSRRGGARTRTRRGGIPHTPPSPDMGRSPSRMSPGPARGRQDTTGSTRSVGHARDRYRGSVRRGRDGIPPLRFPERWGGLRVLKKNSGGGMPDTPLLIYGNCAIVHGSTATLQQQDSDGTAVPGRYSILIGGGLSGPEGGRGIPHTPPPWGGGGLRVFKKNSGGGMPDTPLLIHGNCAILHGSTATPRQQRSDRTAIPGRYSILIGGSVRAGGRMRLPEISSTGMGGIHSPPAQDRRFPAALQGPGHPGYRTGSRRINCLRRHPRSTGLHRWS